MASANGGYLTDTNDTTDIHSLVENEWPVAQADHDEQIEDTTTATCSDITSTSRRSTAGCSRVRNGVCACRREESPNEISRVSTDSTNSNGHCHEEDNSEEIQIQGRRAERVLWIVTGLSAIFIAAEFTGGILAQSLAIATDAGHMLSDLLSFIISIIAIRSSRHPASKRLSFGYDRAEVLGALISVIILWILTTVLVVMAVNRVVEGKYEIDADIMLVTAVCGVIFNLIMGAVLYFGAKSGAHAHSHGGGHTHGGHSHARDGLDNENVEDTRGNVNVRAAFIHVIGDLIQSVGVLIAALIIKFTHWGLADPICTFLFSIIVLFTTVRVLKDIFYVLMEAIPPHIDFNAVARELLQINGVLSLHDLHLWNLSMDKLAFSVHLAIDSNERAMNIVAEARNLMREKFGISTATIQVEPFDKSMEECNKCERLDI